MRADPSPAGLAAVDAVITPRLGIWGHPPLGPVLRPMLNWVIDRKGAARLADALSGLDGEAVMTAMAARLRLEVATVGRDHIPRRGAAILVCNHPTGAADGIAIHEALRPVRRDICYFSSDEALQIAPGLSGALIPVRMDPQSRTLALRKTMLRALVAAIEDERLLVMMPAGAPCRGRTRARFSIRPGRRRPSIWRAASICQWCRCICPRAIQPCTTPSLRCRPACAI